MVKREACIAIYPGTFDPLTNGHVGLIQRGLTVFDTIILAVAKDSSKTTLYSVEERMTMAEEVFSDEPGLMVESYSGLTVDFARKRGANVILRGMRAISDFEFEFQMALMNRKLNRDIQTVFLMTDYRWLYISSTIVKEAAKHGGDVEGLVPDPVFRALKQRFPLLAERHAERERLNGGPRDMKQDC